MRVGDCPSCRAPVEFRPGAGKVKVCDYCHTVVLRGEANLESLVTEVRSHALSGEIPPPMDLPRAPSTTTD